MHLAMLSATIKSDSAFLGIVSAADLITGSALASAVKLTAGTPINDNTDWLVFRHKGKQLYVAKKPLRYGDITPNELDPLNLRAGTQLVIRGKTYLVRCMSTSVTPSPVLPFNTSLDHPATADSEWNSLMYPLVADNPSKKTWGTVFTMADLGMVNDTAGALTLMRESASSNAWIYRGQNRIDEISVGTVVGNPKLRAWRPVLELVG